MLPWLKSRGEASRARHRGRLHCGNGVKYTEQQWCTCDSTKFIGVAGPQRAKVAPPLLKSYIDLN